MNIGNRLGLAAATTGLVALTAAQPATADISNCSDRTLTPTCFAKILEEPYSSDKDAKVALEVRQTDWLRAFQLLWQKPALRKRIHTPEVIKALTTALNDPAAHPIVRQNAAHLMNAMVKYEKRNGKVPESNDYTTLNNLNTARTAIQCMSDGNLPPAVNENCAKLACEASSERSEVSDYMVVYALADTPKRVRAVASACVDLNNPATLNTVIDKITKPGAKGADGDNVQVQALTMATKWYQNRLEDLKKSCRKGKTAKARKKSLQTCRAEIASHKNYAYGRLLDLDMQLISDQKESKAVRDIAAQSATTIGGRDLVIRAFLTRHNYGSYLK